MPDNHHKISKPTSTVDGIVLEEENEAHRVDRNKDEPIKNDEILQRTLRSPSQEAKAAAKSATSLKGHSRKPRELRSKKDARSPQAHPSSTSTARWKRKPRGTKKETNPASQSSHATTSIANTNGDDAVVDSATVEPPLPPIDSAQDDSNDYRPGAFRIGPDGEIVAIEFDRLSSTRLSFPQVLPSNQTGDTFNRAVFGEVVLPPQHQMVIDAEAILEEIDEEGHKLQRNKLWGMVMFVIILIGVCTVGVLYDTGVVMRSKKKNNSLVSTVSTDPPSAAPTSRSASPSTTPTSVPTTLQFKYTHWDLLLSLEEIYFWNISNIFSNRSSPQYRALEWLATTSITFEEDLVEQYVLVIFYFSTGGEDGNWQNDDNWLSKAPVCEWYGVNCTSSENDRRETITELNIVTNGLTGTMIPELALLTSLTRFDLHGNDLAGKIPTEIGQMTNLMYLDLAMSNLSALIPTEIGLMTSLTYLNLFWNNFESTIPSELGQMTRLSYLNIRESFLTGSIPTEIGQMTRLTYLNFFLNALSGTIPTELGQMTRLTYLNFHPTNSNDLTSTIPSELGRMTSLTNVKLSGNALQGTIPTELFLLTNLRSLDFRGNDELMGDVNLMFCNATDNYKTYHSNFPDLAVLYVTFNVTCGCCTWSQSS